MINRDFWFCGPVYWNPGDYELGVLSAEMKRIRECGFDLVRFHNCAPEISTNGDFDFSRTDDWMDAAHQAGLKVSMCAEGFEHPSDELFSRFKMDKAAFLASDLSDRMEQELVEVYMKPVVQHIAKHPALFMWQTLGEPNPLPASLGNPYDIARFTTWLTERYVTVDCLEQAWNPYRRKDKPLVCTLEEAWQFAEIPGMQSAMNGVTNGSILYGAQRDRMLYVAEKGVRRAHNIVSIIKRHDAVHPVAVGSHQLFVNNPALSWKTDEWAKNGDISATSIHLSWHFDLTAGEVEVPVYLQARMTRDSHKLGLASAYETTGGPVQYSGGYPNHMSEGLMRKLMLSYMAAGVNGIAFWTWNARPGGWEMGEYGMTSFSGAVEPWAREAGRIGAQIKDYLPELCYEEDRSEKVAVLDNWDTDALYCLEPDRHDLFSSGMPLASGTKTQGKRAIIGAGRALTYQKKDFEYISEDEVLNGFLSRYHTVLLPHRRVLSMEVIEKLADFAAEGGTLIADVQFAYCDQWGKLHRKGSETIFSKLFGCWVESIHDSRTSRICLGKNPNREVTGMYGELAVSGADVLYRFSNGNPAVTVFKHGKGKTVMLGFDAARMCCEPGHEWVEDLLGLFCGPESFPDYRTDAPLAFQRKQGEIRHFFFIGKDHPRNCYLQMNGSNRYRCIDILDGQTEKTGSLFTFDLDADSAKWLRLQRLP